MKEHLLLASENQKERNKFVKDVTLREKGKCGIKEHEKFDMDLALVIESLGESIEKRISPTTHQILADLEGSLNQFMDIMSLPFFDFKRQRFDDARMGRSKTPGDHRFNLIVHHDGSDRISFDVRKTIEEKEELD